MKGKYLKYNNGKIYYEQKGAGEPLVFIHGFTLDHSMWKEQVEFFSSKYCVCTYDMRGFGKSSAPVGPYSHHDDLRALFSHLGWKSAHVVGLSLGGEVAIDLTVTFPGIVRSLVLADSSLGGYKSTVDWNLHALEFGIEKGKQNWLSHDVFAATRRNKEAVEQLHEIVDAYTGWHLIHSDPRTKLHPSALQRLNEINAPTLVLVGEHDLSYFHDIAKTLHERIKGSRIEVIEGSGHMVNLENANYFNKVVQEFLSSVEVSAASN